MDALRIPKMNVEINNLQNQHNLRLNQIEELLELLMLGARAYLPDRQWDDVSVAIMDDEQIAEVNLAYVGHEGPTDVISFTYPPDPSHPHRFSGEILVNAQLAWEEGLVRESPSNELAFYLAHACLHLMDFDDATPAQRTHMHELQQVLLDQPAVRTLITQGFYEPT